MTGLDYRRLYKPNAKSNHVNATILMRVLSMHMPSGAVLELLALYDWARKLKLAPVLSASVVSPGLSVCSNTNGIPQTWDDHDRS